MERSTVMLKSVVILLLVTGVLGAPTIPTTPSNLATKNVGTTEKPITPIVSKVTVPESTTPKDSKSQNAQVNQDENYLKNAMLSSISILREMKGNSDFKIILNPPKSDKASTVHIVNQIQSEVSDKSSQTLKDGKDHKEKILNNTFDSILSNTETLAADLENGSLKSKRIFPTKTDVKHDNLNAHDKILTSENCSTVDIDIKKSNDVVKTNENTLDNKSKKVISNLSNQDTTKVSLINVNEDSVSSIGNGKALDNGYVRTESENGPLRAGHDSRTASQGRGESEIRPDPLRLTRGGPDNTRLDIESQISELGGADNKKEIKDTSEPGVNNKDKILNSEQQSKTMDVTVKVDTFSSKPDVIKKVTNQNTKIIQKTPDRPNVFGIDRELIALNAFKKLSELEDVKKLIAETKNLEDKISNSKTEFQSSTIKTESETKRNNVAQTSQDSFNNNKSFADKLNSIKQTEIRNVDQKHTEIKQLNQNPVLESSKTPSKVDSINVPNVSKETQTIINQINNLNNNNVGLITKTPSPLVESKVSRENVNKNAPKTRGSRKFYEEASTSDEESTNYPSFFKKEELSKKHPVGIDTSDSTTPISAAKSYQNSNNFRQNAQNKPGITNLPASTTVATPRQSVKQVTNLQWIKIAPAKDENLEVQEANYLSKSAKSFINSQNYPYTQENKYQNKDSSQEEGKFVRILSTPAYGENMKDSSNVNAELNSNYPTVLTPSKIHNENNNQKFKEFSTEDNQSYFNPTQKTLFNISPRTYPVQQNGANTGTIYNTHLANDDNENISKSRDGYRSLQGLSLGGSRQPQQEIETTSEISRVDTSRHNQNNFQNKISPVNEATTRGSRKYLPTRFETISPYITDSHTNKLYAENTLTTKSQSSYVTPRSRTRAPHYAPKVLSTGGGYLDPLTSNAADGSSKDGDLLPPSQGSARPRAYRGSIKYVKDPHYADWAYDDDSFPPQFTYNYKTPTGISAYQKGTLKEINNKKVFVIQGSYNYTAPDGTPVVMTYTADENGFHAKPMAFLQQPNSIPNQDSVKQSKDFNKEISKRRGKIERESSKDKEENKELIHTDKVEIIDNVETKEIKESEERTPYASLGSRRIFTRGARILRKRE